MTKTRVTRDVTTNTQIIATTTAFVVANAYALRAARRSEPVKATHQRDDKCEYEGFQQTLNQIVIGQRLVGVVQYCELVRPSVGTAMT